MAENQRNVNQAEKSITLFHSATCSNMTKTLSILLIAIPIRSPI